MVTERAVIQLKYEGEAVEDGAMDITDAILVLQGFTGAYTRIASAEGSNTTHNLTLRAIKPGSTIFDIVAQANVDNLEAVAVALQVAGAPLIVPVVQAMFELIRLKIRLRGSKPTSANVIDNKIELKDSDNNSITINQNTFKFYRNGQVDKDLERLTAPLGKEGVDLGEYRLVTEDGQEFSQVVDSDDRAFLEDVDSETTRTSERSIVVDLTSLNRYTNKGRLSTQNEKWIPFEYVGQQPDRLLGLFSSKQRLLMVNATVTESDDKGLVRVLIHDFSPLQKDMFDD